MIWSGLKWMLRLSLSKGPCSLMCLVLVSSMALPGTVLMILGLWTPSGVCFGPPFLLLILILLNGDKYCDEKFDSLENKLLAEEKDNMYFATR
jgi:hypothetical protein